VYWIDAHSEDGDFGDETLEKKHRPMLVAGTGWVVKTNKVGITLAMDWAPRESNEGLAVDTLPYRYRFFIPRRNIQRIEWLEPKG
jgi:hypothetical protein